MTNPAGESNDGALRLDFDRRVMLQFRGSVVTSDAGLLAYRELDDVLGLSALASDVLADPRTGRNGRHALAGLFRQSVFGRLAGYEDVNDADRLRHDPAMRWVVGVKATSGAAMIRSAPRPVSVPPTEVAYRLPPWEVTSSSPVSFAKCRLGKTAAYHSEAITMRNCRWSSAAKSPE